MAKKHFDLDPFFPDPHHPHEAIKLSVREKDSVTYVAKKAFTFITFTEKKCKEPKQAQQPAKPAPTNPFYRPFPWEAEQGSDGLWSTDSGPAREEASGYCYDGIFEHGTKKSPAQVAGRGDPDVDIGP